MSMHPPKTQEDVAHDARLSVRHYQKIEAGIGDPKLSTLLAVADALGMRLQTSLTAPKRSDAAAGDVNG